MEQPNPAELALEVDAQPSGVASSTLEERVSAMEANLNRLNETVGDLEARVEDALAKP